MVERIENLTIVEVLPFAGILGGSAIGGTLYYFIEGPLINESNIISPQQKTQLEQHGTYETVAIAHSIQDTKEQGFACFGSLLVSSVLTAIAVDRIHKAIKSRRTSKFSANYST